MTPDRSAVNALVVESRGRLVAFAGFYRDTRQPGQAEVAFAVSDALQGHGIGTRLLERLAVLARAQGIDTFTADVLGDNRRMLDVFRESGFGIGRRSNRASATSSSSLLVTDRFTDRAAARSQAAAAASMEAFFAPKAVAVIGANRGRGKIGSEILHNLIASGYTGTLVAIHPTAAEIDGIRTYARIGDVPGPVDLAVVVVPAAAVLSTARRVHRQGRPRHLRHQRWLQRVRR